MNIKLLILIAMILLLFVCIILLLLIFHVKNKAHAHSSRNKIREPGIIKLSTYLKWYSYINGNSLLRVQLVKIYNGVAELSVYTDIDARRISVQLWCLSNYDVYDEYYINPTSKYESALCKKKMVLLLEFVFIKQLRCDL